MGQNMVCQTCKKEFLGRPNRRYCSIDCRRKAEMAIRGRKKEERHQAMLSAMNSEERAFYDCCREWADNSPTAEEVFGDLPTIEEFFRDLPPLDWPTMENLWPDLKPRDDLPVITWDELLLSELIK